MTICSRLVIKEIRNENVYSSQHCTHFILPSETWISIYNDRNCLIFDNYENGIIRNSLYTFHFLLKGATSRLRLLINFRYINYIQYKKCKCNSPFRSFVKFFCTLIQSFNTFLWASNSRGKSEKKQRKTGKRLRALDILGTRSEIFRASTKKLEEITCVLFVTIIFKTWNNILSIVFRLVWCIVIFLEMNLKALWVSWWWRGWVTKFPKA